MSIFQFILALIFWISLGGIAYSYLLYAVLIKIASVLFGGVRPPPPMDEEKLPSVSLLICAHDEHEVIHRRIENALETDYPKDRLEIVIASDGSTDNTCEIVRGFSDPRVRLIEYTENRGKATALNESVPKLRGSIAVLSDANTRYEPGAIRSLVRWLADPNIIAVCGRLMLLDPVSGKNADGMYWKYETFLKRCEGKLGALLGSNGAIYAVRREQVVALPPTTTIDDFVIPLLGRLKYGGHIAFDDAARASELTPPDLRSEFNRRSRIGGGVFGCIQFLWPLLDPRGGWIALTFFSHKILRWVCPLFMIAMLVTSALLWRLPFYRWMLALQILFYLCSWVTIYLPAGIRWLRPLRLTTMFTTMNMALLVGLVRWIFGTHTGTWKRTSRKAEAGRRVEAI
jgi:cellulose synthase/poly-beta-1,6-N-acetylglucosamine synthase-like glycosyltransferase